MQYEGINAICFVCGRVGHRTEGCPYSTWKPELEETTNDETEVASSQRAGKEHEESDRGDFGPWILVTHSPSQPSHASSPLTGPVALGLRLNKEKHTLSDLTRDNGMSADHTKSNPSLEKSTTKQKAQKGKVPSRRQQINHSQKNSFEWRIVNSKLFGSSPPLKGGLERMDFSSLAIDFKGFQAVCSMGTAQG